jgi:hypothetical protein
VLDRQERQPVLFDGPLQLVQRDAGLQQLAEQLLASLPRVAGESL